MDEELEELEELEEKSDKTSKFKQKQTKKEGVSLTSIATQTAPAFQLPEGKVVSFEEYLVWLGNQVYAIKQAVV